MSETKAGEARPPGREASPTVGRAGLRRGQCRAGVANRLSSALPLLLVLLGVSGPLASQRAAPGSLHAGGDADLRARIDAYVAPLVEAGDLSGTLLVARDGRIVYERAFGMASYELGVANTVATQHGIGSVTKLLTVVLTLKLADEGVLDLDDALDTHLPGFPRGEEITVEHLLRHRSGIPHRVTADEAVSTARSAAEMVELALDHELLFAPGAERAYSSAGYAVLARVLEVATGRRYPDLLEQEVLVPAGALHTASDDGWRLVPNRSDDYLRGSRGPIPADRANLSFLVGGGSGFSTPGDLLRVIRTLESGGYGDLARSQLLEEEGTLSWNGRTFGYRAFVDHGSPPGGTVIFAGNLQTGAVDLARRDVPRLVSGQDVPPPSLPEREPLLLAPDARRALEGVYQFRAGEPDSEEVLRFAPDGGFAKLGSWVLVPVTESRLFSTTDYATLEIRRADDGSVRRLVWRKGDASFTLPRVRDVP